MSDLLFVYRMSKLVKVEFTKILIKKIKNGNKRNSYNYL